MDLTFLTYVKRELAKLRPADFGLVAKETGIPESTIRKIHYGEVTDPRVGTIQSLYDHFKRLEAA